jgi:hypothetical protein
MAAEKLAEQLSQYDIGCYRMLFPKNMDANEYALQMSPASKILGLVIRKAEPMLNAKTRKQAIEKSKNVNQKEEENTSSLVEYLSKPTSQAQLKCPIEIDAQINECEIKIMFTSVLRRKNQTLIFVVLTFERKDYARNHQ